MLPNSISHEVLYHKSLYLAKNYFSKLHSRRAGEATFNLQSVSRGEDLLYKSVPDQFHLHT